MINYMKLNATENQWQFSKSLNELKIALQWRIWSCISKVIKSAFLSKFFWNNRSYCTEFITYLWNKSLKQFLIIIHIEWTYFIASYRSHWFSWIISKYLCDRQIFFIKWTVNRHMFNRQIEWWTVCSLAHYARHIK